MMQGSIRIFRIVTGLRETVRCSEGETQDVFDYSPAVENNELPGSYMTCIPIGKHEGLEDVPE